MLEPSDESVSTSPTSPPPTAEASGGPEVLTPVSAEVFETKLRRRRMAIGVAAILVLAVAGYIYKRSTDPLRALEAFDAGERLFKIARYTQAIISLDSAVGYRPDYWEAYLLRGRARIGMGDALGAIPDLTKVTQIRPGEAQAYLARAMGYLELHDYRSALADCAKAIEINPRLSFAYNLKGSVMRDMGSPRESIAEFTKAITLEENLDNYIQRGSTYQVLEEHNLAIADFDTAIKFFPDSPEAYFARAKSKRALGDLKGAEEDHRLGRSLDGK